MTKTREAINNYPHSKPVNVDELTDIQALLCMAIHDLATARPDCQNDQLLEIFDTAYQERIWETKGP